MLSGGEGYFWPGTSGTGVLLIHGFTGTPAELRELGEILHKRGHTVQGLLLSGHGTMPKELCKVPFTQWETQVVEAVKALRHCCHKVFVIGLSMGGLLALYAGAKTAVDGIVSISTPIYIYDWRIHFLWLADRLPHWAIPKRRRHIDAARRFDVSYHCMPIYGVHQLAALLQQVKRLLPHVTAPLLIFQSKTEHTVRPESADYIYDKTGSQKKTLCWVPGARHVMTLYRGRIKVYQAILAFVEES